MSELPGGWMELKLGDVVNYADNTTVQPDAMQEDAWLLELEDIERDSSRILAYETVGKRKPQSAKNCFHAGDVLYGKLRPYLNKVVRADRNGYSSSEIIAIKPNQLDGGYLFHYLKSPCFRDYVQAVTHGVRMPRLGTEQAKTAPFLLPPLAEQKRIAQKLDALLAQVDTLKARIDAIPALLKRFRQSTLAAAFSARLTGEAPAEFDHWQEAKFSSVIEDLRYGTAQKCDYNGGTTGVLRIPNIGDRGIVLSDMKSSDFSETEIKKLELMKGDIVLIRSNGSVELVGKSALVSEKEQGLLFAGYLIRIRLDQAKSIPEFVNYWLKSPAIRQVIEQIARSTSGVNNINSEEIKSLTFTFPSLSAQAEIVRRVEQLFACADQLEAKVATAQQRIDGLTQSLLAKAFRGKLVPQDPSDEPASVLLERIRTQRAATPKPKRGRKKV
ncbi:hypothetical protein XA1311A_11770 [Xanthomonas arboricola]|uniref:restriction endonuclease subunit S n=1 Tax=Xanthomonas arboricola TaxID=56448 RepID=UPI001E323453|nr:restriction endonuclease subunit S [Xanthomonas arboricola]CAE6730713.1 hypothetical protein XA1311A_11770 [Xanthomonas arboricola]CAE6730742.1 hypothetical protein XA1311A_11770 [Xanthomonas arboricola]